MAVVNWAILYKLLSSKSSFMPYKQQAYLGGRSIAGVFYLSSVNAIWGIALA
jgi:hypothetical protein